MRQIRSRLRDPVRLGMTIAFVSAMLPCLGCGGEGFYSLGRVTPTSFQVDVCATDTPKLVGEVEIRFNSRLKPHERHAVLGEIGASLSVHHLGAAAGPGRDLSDGDTLEIWATSSDFIEETFVIGFAYDPEREYAVGFSDGGIQRTRVTVRNTCAPVPDPEPEPDPEPPAPPAPDPTRIVFSSDRDGDGEIYVVADDGTGLVQLTQNDGEDTDPAWSPDGRRIVFLSDEDALPSWPDLPDLYLMNADGTDVERLTFLSTDGISVEDPAWSPDGRKIAYALPWGIEVLVLDTGITHLITDEAGDRAPAWDPDSARVAFHRDGDLYLAEDVVPWKSASPLLEHQSYDDAPSWTPNGWDDRVIAYVADGDLRITVEPNIIEQLVTGGGVRTPSWAPVVDGAPTRRIVFVRNGVLLLVDVVSRNITSLAEEGADPNWGLSPP